MSWLTKNSSTVTKALTPGGFANDILGFGSKPGPKNPYPRPDLSYLADTSKFDYLKNPDMYKSLLDTSGYDFLKKPVAPTTSFANPNSAGNLSFNDLIKTINAPSSVDQVNSELDNDRLKQLMEGVDIDTRNTVGSLKSDFADRGLGGPGIGSDIEFNSLAQAYGDANRTKASARTTLAQSELERLKAKETAAQGAYSDRYKTVANAENTADESAAARTNQNQLTFASLLNADKGNYVNALQSGNNLFAQLLNARDLGAAGINSTNYNTANEDQYKFMQPGYFDNILRNVQVSVSPKM